MNGFEPRFTITNAITAGLTEIERARGFLDAATLSERWIDRMRSRAILLEAHFTTHIEGTQLSLDQAERIWNDRNAGDADPDDVRELLNYRSAFELVGDYLKCEAPITESLIREIHRRLVQGVRGDMGLPGQYRNIQNYIVRGATGEVVYTPPPPEEVAPLMAELVAWLNHDTDVHPVLVSGIAQFQLVHIHPFVDGNGRTSRLLSTLWLYRCGYDFKRLFTLSEYYDRDPTAFYRAIQSVREHGMDLTFWLEYFTLGLAAQLEEVKSRGADAIRADVLAKDRGLNDRQAAALALVIARGGITIRDFEQLCPDTSRRTLQRDLAALESAGLVVRAGGTNQLIYKSGSGL